MLINDVISRSINYVWIEFPIITFDNAINPKFTAIGDDSRRLQTVWIYAV